MKTITYRIVVLPGDGIGPEVAEQAIGVLEALNDGSTQDEQGRTVRLGLETWPFGGTAVDQAGEALPETTWRACRDADAILLGAIGGPRWDRLPVKNRPEPALLALRKRLGAFANLRPIKRWLPGQPGALPIDLMIVRELTGGIYFGEPRATEVLPSGRRRALDTMVYTEDEIERIARVGFETARRREGRLTSVDKANVLDTSRLWRATVDRLAPEYPDVTLDHQLVDSFAARMVQRPDDIDTVVTGNLFGDILSDLGGGIVGTLGVLPSASVGDGSAPGLFEPVHGSAPDIAGKNEANPTGMILSAALLLRHGLHLESAAVRVEKAVQDVIDRGLRTPDVPGERTVTTEEFGRAVRAALT